MARHIRARFVLGSLALLLCNSVRSELTGTHSLYLSFTVKFYAQHGQPWCEVQGSMDQNPVLQYDCDTKKATPLDLLKEEVINTDTWKKMTDELQNMGQEFRQWLYNIKLEMNKTKDNPTLESKMFCQFHGNQSINASWCFSINGKQSLCFNSMINKWTMTHPRAKEIMEKLENYRDMEKYFGKVSMGDCQLWIQEFLAHRRKMPGSTSEAPPTSQSPISSDNQTIPWAISSIGGIIGGSIIGGSIGISAISAIIFKIIRACYRRAGTRKGQSFDYDKQTFQDEVPPPYSTKSNEPTNLQLEPLNQGTSVIYMDSKTMGNTTELYSSIKKNKITSFIRRWKEAGRGGAHL